MGITINDFFENIYSVIFSPKAFFERKDMTVSVRLAIGTVIFIASFYKIASGILDKSVLDFWFILKLIWFNITTLFWWFIAALYFEYIAKIFDRDGNIKKLLFLTSFAPVPYIFFVPLNLLKNSCSLGFAIATLTEFALYIWIIYLYTIALKSVYNITNARAFMLLFIPFISALFALYQMVCFLQKMWFIFSV